jgi:hypothetical protein
MIEASVRVAKSRAEGSCYTRIPYGLARAPSERQRQAMGLKERSICGKPNTLVIANTSGFHRQGTFQDDRPREKILLDFRWAESWNNYLA